MHAPRNVVALQLALFAVGLSGAFGCATEQKVLKAPHYALAYPEYWKVQAVAQKDGEPTKLVIGKYSETIISDGESATADSIYERSQAEVEARIYTWPADAEAGDATKKVADRLSNDADLQLPKQGLIRSPGEECGGKFKRKFTVLQKEEETMDLASQPGHRLILVGSQKAGLLLGVVTRVPFEQDVGLYCHNLSNMRLQLQNVLDGMTLEPPGAAAAK
jgi:hypothetical protein